MKSTAYAKADALLLEEMRALGLKRIGSGGVYASSVGEVTCIAYLRKSRLDESFQLVVGVSGNDEASAALRRDSGSLKESAIGGDASAWGIGAEKWWRFNCVSSEQLFLESIRVVVSRWFSQFQYPSSWSALRAIENREQLSSEDSCQVLSQEAFRDYWRRVSPADLGLSGFEVSESPRQFAYVRKRGDFWDVVEPAYSSFGFHTVVKCFVTSPAIFAARRELKGLLVQTNGGELGAAGFSSGIRCIETASVRTSLGKSTARERLEDQAIPFFGEISDRETFMERLGMGWEQAIGPALSRIWSVK